MLRPAVRWCDAEGRRLDTVPLSDPRVAAVEVREGGELLIDLREVGVLRLDQRPAGPGEAPVRLRLGVVDRLVTRRRCSPPGCACS